jgi:hypothetical protein
MLFSIKTSMLRIFFHDNNLQKAKQNGSTKTRASGLMNMANENLAAM